MRLSGTPSKPSKTTRKNEIEACAEYYSELIFDALVNNWLTTDEIHELFTENNYTFENFNENDGILNISLNVGAAIKSGKIDFRRFAYLYYCGLTSHQIRSDLENNAINMRELICLLDCNIGLLPGLTPEAAEQILKEALKKGLISLEFVRRLIQYKEISIDIRSQNGHYNLAMGNYGKIREIMLTDEDEIDGPGIPNLFEGDIVVTKDRTHALIQGFKDRVKKCVRIKPNGGRSKHIALDDIKERIIDDDTRN